MGAIITPFENELAAEIVDSAFQVHKALGPGLLEKIYETCFCHELTKRGLGVKRQVKLPIKYDGILFEEGLILDVLIEDTVICELKAVDLVNPFWKAQLLSHLRLAGLQLGFIINFNVPLIKDGIKRYIVG